MYTLGIDAFSSRPERSGVEWYTHHLLRAMEPETPPDWRVFLYSLRTTNELRTLRTSEAWAWKQLRWLPRRGWGQLRLSWEMLRRSPNVLFVPGAMIPFIHPHRPWRKQWTVTTIHDVEFLSHPKRYHPADRRRQEVALDFALHHAARIFVPSEVVRGALADRARDDQLVVTPLGVDHAQYRPIKDTQMLESIRKKYQLPELFLLYVSRIDAKKNLSILINAFAAYKKQGRPGVLALAGASGYCADEVVAAIKKHDLTDAVRLLGYVPEDDLPALYGAARAFVFPSLHEGFGLPVLQALACGVSTLVADTPIMHEVAGDAALFGDPDSPDAWVAGLGEIMQNDGVRAHLHEAGLRRAQEFGWERTAQKTWAAILHLTLDT